MLGLDEPDNERDPEEPPRARQREEVKEGEEGEDGDEEEEEEEEDDERDERDEGESTPVHWAQCDLATCQKWRLLLQPPWQPEHFLCQAVKKRGCAEACDGCHLPRCDCPDKTE
jgi:hypothetical protein